MNAQPTFKGLFASVRDSLPHKVESAILGFTEQIGERIKALGFSRSELAVKLDASPAYVTKFMSGSTNFTLESMVKVADALDCEIRVDVVPRYSPAVWIQVADRLNPIPSPDPLVWSARQRNRVTFPDMETPELFGPPCFGCASVPDQSYQRAA